MLNSLSLGASPNMQLPVHSIQKNLLDNLQNKKKPSSKLSQHNQSEAIIDTLNTSVPRKKRKPRGQFGHLKYKDLQAWKDEYNLHPEWQGLSTTEIREKKESGGRAFYEAFNEWKNEQTKDKKERERLKNEIFPDRHKDRSDFHTIQAWKEYYNKHPEWQLLSTDEMGKEKESGGQAFYAAFNSWKNEQTKDPKERERLKNEIFPDKSQFGHLKYKDIQAWKDEYNLHPEWQGLSTDEIREEKESGGYTFYRAFNRWKNEQTKDKKERERLKNEIFPDRHKDRSDFHTIQAWKEYYNKHPEWQLLSTKEIGKGKESGGNAFYKAFNKWKNGQTKDKDERARLKNEIFPDRNKDRSDLKTIQAWKEYYNKHPEWQGLSTDEIRKEIESGLLAFYQAFNKWKNGQTKDKDEREILKNEIFPDRNKDRSDFKTIQAWKEYYNLHPEWQGLSTDEIREEKESGGYAFYQAFNSWKNGQTKDKDERARLKNEIFPDKAKKCYYRFQNNVLEFDSYSERKCALILYNLGMINDFVEGHNLHVLTYVGLENKDRASVDFRIGSVFLEYHTGGRGKKFIDEAQRKNKNITSPKYQGITELYVFDDIYKLYDIIKKDKILIKHIPQNKLIYLSHPDEFKRLIYTVHKQLEEYDSINLDQLPQAA